MHPAVSSGDLGKVALLMSQRALTDQDKYFLLTNHFSTYKFPLVSRGRQNHSFQHRWLSQYNGLVYSELDKGCYCKYCVLFRQAPSSVSNLTGVLITHTLTNLQKASEKLREHFTGVGTHATRKYHLAAVGKAMHFWSVVEKCGKVVCNYLILCPRNCVLLGIYTVVRYLIVKSVRGRLIEPSA